MDESEDEICRMASDEEIYRRAFEEEKEKLRIERIKKKAIEDAHNEDAGISKKHAKTRLGRMLQRGDILLNGGHKEFLHLSTPDLEYREKETRQKLSKAEGELNAYTHELLVRNSKQPKYVYERERKKSQVEETNKDTLRTSRGLAGWQQQIREDQAMLHSHKKYVELTKACQKLKNDLQRIKSELKVRRSLKTY